MSLAGMMGGYSTLFSPLKMGIFIKTAISRGEKRMMNEKIFIKNFTLSAEAGSAASLAGESSEFPHAGPSQSGFYGDLS